MNLGVRNKYILLIAGFISLSCLIYSYFEQSNDTIYSCFESKFYESISKSNAKSFNYLYDGLVPQKSFFCNNKLNYLYFRHGPELGYTEGLVYFENDSIEKLIFRKVLPDYTSKFNDELYDSLFVIYPKENKTEIYFDDDLIDKKFRTDILVENFDFVYAMKNQTEIEFKKSTLN